MEARLFKNILLVLLLFVSLLTSCNDKETETIKSTYIGGQIINPTVDYIVFNKGNQLLDTVKLDANNFFHYRTDKIKTGLYFLKHGESQVFFIEPGDSLLIHVNTIDFDESLAYSGKGGEQNNLLIELYLLNEIENQTLPKWYALNSTEFEKKIDSLRDRKIQHYKEFLENNKIDERFEDVAMANINYDHYSKKEMYAAANRRNADALGKDFFAYRKQIDFDQNELKYYYPYYRFMNRYFENLVCAEIGDGTSIDRYSFDYNLKKIKIIDSVVTSDSLKNSLLRYNAMWYLLNSKNADEETAFFEWYAKLNTDKKNLEEVRKLYEASVKLTSGNPIPKIALVNTDNVLVSLEAIITAPTVVYFWTGHSASQYKNIHNRAAELKAKYPEYDFLAINTDTHFKKWRETVRKAKYNPETEYQLENLADAEKKLVLNAMNKVIIVDKDGIILEGKTNMFHSNFEELLLGYLNR